MAQCQLCNDLEKKDADDFRLAFDFAPEQLLASKKSQNCISCALILDGILRFEDKTWTFAKEVSRVYVYALESESDSLTLEIYFKADRLKLVLEFFSLNGGDQQRHSPGWKAIRPRTSITGYPVLLNGVRWVDTILQNCLTKHSSCPSTKNNLLPKRLLVFKRFASGEINVRVQENQGQKGRYNALSYCWGSSQTFITTSKTLRDYKMAIPWTELPNTFRDSIIISLELGIDHLWIDALCIVQDDPSDWEVESAKMADIYQNAFVTLAATASNSGDEGCFSINHVPVREYHLDSSALRQKLSSIMVREKVEHWTAPPTNLSLQSHPLLSRGWAFQERKLSARVLHFCKQELVWECTEETICECGGISAVSKPHKPLLSITNSNLGSQQSRTITQKLKGLTTNLLWRKAPNSEMAKTLSSLSGSKIVETSSRATELRNLKPLSEEWHSIVEQYSALKLTRETDRLPALSGLAERASPFFGQYLCGLWFDTLISDLLWRVNTLDYEHGRPIKYTGPSWSWASVKGPVSYWLNPDNSEEENEALQRLDSYSVSLDNQYDRQKAEVKAIETRRLIASLKSKAEHTSFACSVIAAGKNPFGEVSPGFIDIRGYFQEATLKYVHTNSSYGSRVTHDPLQYQVGIDGTDVESNFELSFFADYVLSAPGPNILVNGSKLFLLLVHPYVSLVLRSGRHLSFYSSGYERVGVIRQPSALPLLYNLDWMQCSALVTVRIF